LPTSFNTGGIVVQVPQMPASLVDVAFSPGDVFAGTVTAYYYFYPPGGGLPSTAQPPTTKNSEAVSAANAAVSTTITRTDDAQHSYLFNVSARCSAGSAQLTVTDGLSQIFSSG